MASSHIGLRVYVWLLQLVLPRRDVWTRGSEREQSRQRRRRSRVELKNLQLTAPRPNHQYAVPELLL